VQVDLLLGPREATVTNVLRRLYNTTYDVLHYAGHCAFDEKEPLKSGWLFSGGKFLTANELRRIDMVPKFVFSNACESGVTPDRSEQADTALAPSFAEAFFERGVSNFVCTAWPINDIAAREFALTLYAHLVGVKRPAETETAGIRERRTTRPTRVEPIPMYSAMQQARKAIAETVYGVRSWGAYQHYGNPWLQLFRGTASTPASEASARKATGSREPRRQTRGPASGSDLKSERGRGSGPSPEGPRGKPLGEAPSYEPELIEAKADAPKDVRRHAPANKETGDMFGQRGGKANTSRQRRRR
jgi:hypothetical protein